MKNNTRAERIQNVKTIINQALKKWHPDHSPVPSAPAKTRQLIWLKKYVDNRYGKAEQ